MGLGRFSGALEELPDAAVGVCFEALLLVAVLLGLPPEVVGYGYLNPSSLFLNSVLEPGTRAEAFSNEM